VSANYSLKRTAATGCGILTLIAAAAAYLKRYTAMAHRTRWSTDDFDEMSWHDVHVHGFQIVRNDDKSGTAELVLDIDYILEWLKNENKLSFVVAQASLRFHEVFGLKFTLDYVTTTAGMCAFSLEGIKRERIQLPTGYTSYKWKLGINWPAGEIEFQSPGFTQSLTGKLYTQPGQWLEPPQRLYAVAV